jgi:hypothetical protein
VALEISPYHRLTDIGLTAWNSEEQSYFLIPFAAVSGFFKQTSEQINVPHDLVDAAFDFMANYNPESEVVLLTLNEDLLTVAVINKYEPATKEAKAEKIGWALPKYTAFEYVILQDTPIEQVMGIFKLTPEQYDEALSVVYND